MVELKLERCTLRAWRSEDAASLVRSANNTAVWRNLRDRFPHPYTARHAATWIRTSRRATQFAIDVGGEAVGGVGYLVGEDVYRRSAEVGFWLAEPFWGRGIMTEAVLAITRLAFERHDICRVYAEVFEWNVASMRVLEKAGYAREARLRRAVTKDGQTIDEMVYAILKQEPRATGH
jgi:RimJ/RimL family protein N-acetyltransferase